MAVKEQKTLRVGVIGCGGIANGKHIPNLNANKNVELVAFCDIIEERAVESAKKIGREDIAIYTDYKELLKDESIDLVHVCTPNKSTRSLPSLRWKPANT
ncbi:putative oxidoreductase YcjS [Paenibacillus sp. P1XP2]|nr:putative oxidoreductase YcjS [Paenibacillus sp. P1XP2]